LRIATVALVGMAVLIAWYAQWTSILQVFPAASAIKYNTGLCFIVAFLALAVGFLAWTRQGPHQEGFDLRSWLPIVGSVTVMAMIAFVTSISMLHLKSSYDWRMHTYDVLLRAQALRGDITGMQRGARDYVLTGQQATLEPYWASDRDASLQLSGLRNLTADNAAQRPRLAKLSTDISGISAYAKGLVAVRDSQGVDAAIRLESSGDGRLGTDRALADLQSFSGAESRLLYTRIALARDNLVSTARFLVLASILAAALLAWAHFRNRVEMDRRRRVEAALHKLSTLQTAILNAANYAIISSSVDHVVTTFNSTAERWLGYAAADVIGKAAPAAWYDAAEVLVRAQALSAELGYSVSGSFETLIAKARLGQREENEWTMIRKDGSRFPVWRSITPQVDAAGTIVGYVSVITDISERKVHEAEIRLNEERFRRAFDDAPIGMALVSVAGRWLKVNRALCDILGYSTAELLEKDVQSATHRDDREPTEELIRQALAGQDSPYYLEKRYVRKDGSMVFASVSVSLVRDRAGTPLYFISQVEDVTQRMEVERMKGEFVSTVSHELRTPLTSIRGALGLIDAGVLGKLPEKAEAMVKIAHQNSHRLVRIVNDILDIEKISSGKLEMRIESVPIAAFLEESIAVNQPYGVKQEIRFVLEAMPRDANFLTDRDRLLQVMANLLSNAAKFSPPGAQVQVRAIDRGARVRIEVEDRGAGIPEAFRERVFEKFAQADSSTTRCFAGTGLGLSITRELIRAMDGTIGFTTVTGEGTTFYFELPRAATSLPLPEDPAEAHHKVANYRDDSKASREHVGNARILYVEDDVDLSHVIDTALAGRVQVVTATTLQAAEKLLREECFSLLVLDLGLPDGNGLSLLEELPALTAIPIPVLILSATEVSQEIKERVALALVKSRVSEAHIVTAVLSLLPQTMSQSVAAA
jgi:PAS domain S-box-containing protein